MSKTNKFSRIAFLVSAVITLAACDSGEGTVGGGGSEVVEVASDSCLAVAVADGAASYSSNMAHLVESTEAGEFQYSIVEEPSNGTLTSFDPSTGDYTFTPNTSLTGARGFKTSFTYGVLEDGEQVDSGVVELIYGAKRIMPLGDSITFGVIYNSGTTSATDEPAADEAIGYRKTLYDRLVAEGYSIEFVGGEDAGGNAGLADTSHEGHPGMRASTMASNVTGYLEGSKPDVVLAHTGTNDLYLLSSEEDASDAVQEMVTNMQTWQSGLTEAQPLTVIQAQIIPSATGSGVALSTIESFNTLMANKLSATFDNTSNPDFQVRLVDQYSDLSPSTDMTTRGTGTGQDRNGLHPNTSGYTKIANNWYDAIIATGELEKCD